MLNSDDDFSCLMSDPMFQMSTNGMNGHQVQNNHQQQQTATSHQNVNSYNPHPISQMTTTVVPTSHSAELPHMLNTRKRKCQPIENFDIFYENLKKKKKQRN